MLLVPHAGPTFKFRKIPGYWTSNLSECELKPKNCRVGDRFELHFDFVQRQATAFCNGVKLGFITEELPRDIFAAVSLSNEGDSVEITKFKVVEL